MMIKKKDCYYPSPELKEKAWVKDDSIYHKAAKDPVKFWEGLAQELFWFKHWDKAFVHNPPYFQWFAGGKTNITYNALERNLETRRNKVALIWEPEPAGESRKVFTYYELAREVNRAANALRKMGVNRGDRVGIYLPMIPEVIIAMLACARIGAIHSVVFSAFSPTALNARLVDSGAKVLITVDGYYRRGKVVDLKTNADIAVRKTKVKKILVINRAGNEIKWNKERDFWWHEIVDKEEPFCKPEPMDSEDPLFILYTSGSTGKPKGCVHTVGGYSVQAYWTAKWIFDLKDDDVFWSMADIGWVTGHTYSCYGPLLNGATFVIFEGAPDYPEPDRWCQIIEKYGVTTFYTAPTAIRMFEKYGEEHLKPYKFNTLQILGSVGEPIDKAAWDWYFCKVGKKRCPLVDTWWQTETGGILLTSLPGVGPFRPTFTGLPFPGLRFDILDEKGESLPADKQGNLVLLPPFAPGLLRNVYKNTKRYRDTYWSKYGTEIYFTSDAAYRDKEGLIRIVGRVDDVIKVAGHRVTTGEIESAIALHKDITECAVIGVPDNIRGEIPVAFVVSKTERSASQIAKEVVWQVRKEIGPIALPKKVYLVKDLPKTRSGKIMRRILRRLFTKEPLGDLSTLANPDSVERLKKIVNTDITS